MEIELSVLTHEEFSKFPPVLSLSGLFYEKDLVYTYEDYTEHLLQTKEFAESHPNYAVKMSYGIQREIPGHPFLYPSSETEVCH